MKTQTKLLLGLIIAVLLMLPLLTFAQTNTVGVGTTSGTGTVTGSPVADAGSLIAALMLVSAFFKNAIPSFPNRLIPLLTWILGTVGYMLMTGSHWDGKSIFSAFTVAATATALHSGIKNTFQPGDDSGGGGAGKLGMWLIAALMIGLGGMACAPLNPNANAVVVRVEQASTSAKATFDLIVNTDSANRAFWKTNAPAFHQFAEDLRVPTPVAYNGGTTNLPRCIAALWSLDEVKKSYKAGLVTSNAMVTAETTVTSLLDQANTWLAFTVTNHP